MDTDALIYGRQSHGKDKSIAEQLDLGTKRAAAEGWHVAGEYQDRVSASRYTAKVRDEWARLLEQLRQPGVSILWLWESSRGDRQLSTWAQLLETCREHRVRIYVETHGRLYDMASARDWRTMAEDGVDNQYESERTSGRVRRGIDGAKAAGRPLAHVPMGYVKTRDPGSGAVTGVVTEPEGTARVREVFRLLDGGHPVSEAARITGVTRQVIRYMARNLSYIAKRRLDDGTLVDTTWEPIIEEAQFWRVQEILGTHHGAGERPGAYRSLLAHLATCGKCGGATVTTRRGGEPRYRCEKGCFYITDTEGADDRVMYQVLGWLEVPGNLERFIPQDGGEAASARAEAAQIRQRLAELGESYAAGRVSIAVLEAAEGKLRPALASAEERARKLAVPPALERFAGTAFPRYSAAYQTWTEMPLAARRDLLRAVAEVRIHPRRSVASADEQFEVSLPWQEEAAC